LAKDAHEKPELVIHFFLIDQMECFFSINLSANTVRHVTHSMPDIKTVMGVLMDKSRVFAHSTVINNYCAAVSALIDGVSGNFILNMDETGFVDFAEAGNATSLAFLPPHSSDQV
jgi:hypothetical protein